MTSRFSRATTACSSCRQIRGKSGQIRATPGKKRAKKSKVERPCFSNSNSLISPPARLARRFRHSRFAGLRAAAPCWRARSYFLPRLGPGPIQTRDCRDRYRSRTLPRCAGHPTGAAPNCHHDCGRTPLIYAWYNRPGRAMPQSSRVLRRPWQYLQPLFAVETGTSAAIRRLRTVFLLADACAGRLISQHCLALGK